MSTNLRLQLRKQTAAAWTAANPVLLAGEQGFETDTGGVKIGDGVTAWNALGYQEDLVAQSKADSSGLEASTAMSAANSAASAAVGGTDSVGRSMATSAGVKAISADSKSDSDGLQASAANSNAISAASKAISADSKADSAGLEASTAESVATSVASGGGAGTDSIARSMADSSGTAASSADSKAVSDSLNTSTALSTANTQNTSQSVLISTAYSKGDSSAVIANSANTSATSAGTAASTAQSIAVSANSKAVSADSKADSDGLAASVADSKAVSAGTAGFVSAAQGISFFLDDTTIIAPSTNNAIDVNTLTKVPITTTEVLDSWACTSNTVIGEAYLYNTALGRTVIDAGVWDFYFWCSVSSVLAGRVSTISAAIYDPIAGAGTVATTGTGTSRTATITAGTPFVAGDANADITLCGYLQTPQGLYPISAYTSSSVVTITVPSTYANETGVSYTKWKWLFKVTTPAITAITTSYALLKVSSAQSQFSISTTDKLGAVYFATSNNTTTVYMTHNGSDRYSYFQTPLITLHNLLAGLQGGTSNEFYHLTSAQVSEVDLNATSDSKATSAGLAASTADSKAVSDSLLTSTSDSKAVSAGSQAGSVGTSAATGVSTASSKGDSAATIANSANTSATSAGTAASTAQSVAVSANSKAVSADSKSDSAGTEASNAQSAVNSLASAGGTTDSIARSKGDSAGTYASAAESLANTQNTSQSLLISTADSKAASAGTAAGSGGGGQLKAAWDGQGNLLDTAVVVLLPIEKTLTISSISLVGDASGSVTVSVARYTPSAGALGSPTALGTGALSSTQQSRDTTLSGWTKSVTAGDVLSFTLSSVTTLTRLVCTLGY